MSQENVEIVLGLQAGPDVDLTQFFRDDRGWEETASAVAPLLHRDSQFITKSAPRDEAPRPGLSGLREGFLDWFKPWATYRTVTEEAIDGGDRVVLLSLEYGRLTPDTEQVRRETASVWTFRDGKIIRMETYPDRAEALKAVGLEG